MASEDSFDSSCLCCVIVLHRITVSADQIDVAWCQVGLSQSTFDCPCNRIPCFVDFPKMRTFISAPHAQNLCVDRRCSSTCRSLTLQAQRGPALGKEKSRAPRPQRSTCLLKRALPLGEHAYRMKNGQ